MSDLASDEYGEIEQDLADQGLDMSPDEVIGTFGLFETMKPYSMDPEPIRPAYGPDWTYTRQPEDNFFPALSDEGHEEPAL